MLTEKTFARGSLYRGIKDVLPQEIDRALLKPLDILSSASHSAATSSRSHGRPGPAESELFHEYAGWVYESVKKFLTGRFNQQLSGS